MPLFNLKSRKPRISRAASIGVSMTWTGRLSERLRDRGVVLRLMICIGGMIGLLVAVEGWKAPFVYRLGDQPEHGIVAKIDFSREDPKATEREQTVRVSRVPHVFTHDPTALDTLEATLREDLKEVAASEELENLSIETRRAFGIANPDELVSTDPTDDERERFRVLRALLVGQEAAETASLETTETPDDNIAVAIATGPASIVDTSTSDVETPAASPITPESEDPVTTVADESTQEAQRTEAEKAAAIAAGIEAVAVQFQQVLEVLRKIGVANIEEVEDVSNSVGSDAQLSVVTLKDSNPIGVVRIGEVLLTEVLKETGRVGVAWPTSWTSIRPQMEQWLRSHIPITLKYDRQATQAARQRVRVTTPAVIDSYATNDVLVIAGRPIDEEDLAVLQAEYAEAERQVTWPQRVARTVTVFTMIVVLAVLHGYYLVRNESRITKSSSQLAVYLLAIIVSTAIGRALSGSYRAEVVPVIVTVMIVAIAYNQVLAALTGFTVCLILVLSTVANLGQFVLLMTVAASAVLPLARVSSRSSIIKIGFTTGLVYFIASWGTGVIASQSLTPLWSDSQLLINSLAGAGWCIAAGYLVAGSLPFIESAFGVVTDISLLELSDISHPLLQELVRRAPGTYNHSIAVATIGEAAAESIGANGLLVRVGAYFHDIGKMLKPGYFIENMTEGDESRHENLAPAMSALIIIGHVKDGVDLAHQYHLPPALIDFIEQHHGTTLVQYFYHEAAKQADEDHKTDADESLFRYPGPNPQSREAGVMMLADAVESASRTLSEPTPKRIENLVQKITMDRLMDNQLDESTLTLNEVRAIEDSLTKSLIAIYHGRIKYPEQRTA